MNQFQQRLEEAKEQACPRCNGNGWLGARVFVGETYGDNTRSRDAGEQCPNCKGSGLA